MVKNALNSKVMPVLGERDFGVSLTTPDMGYTVKQLIFRQSNGLPVNVSVRDASFDEEDDTVDFGSLDMIDREAFARRYEETLLDLRKKDENRKKAALEAAKKRVALEKEVRDFLNKRDAVGQPDNGTNNT